MDRYAAELEADFQSEYGLEFGKLWRARRIRRMLSLIDQLPPATRFSNAVANDEEHVERLLASGVQPSSAPSGPSLREWTPEVALLTDISDQLQGVVVAILAAAGAGANAGKVKPRARPTTAFDTVKHRQAVARHEALVRRVIRRQPAEQALR